MSRTIIGVLLHHGRITRTHITSSPEQPQYRAIQQALGADTFDVFGLTDGIDLFIDDEGAINGSPLNLAATVLAHSLGTGATLFGSALLLATDGTGATTSLSPEQEHAITTALTAPGAEVLATIAHTLHAAGLRVTS